MTRTDAERAHRIGFRAIRAAGPVLRRLPDAAASAGPAAGPVEVMGLRFPSRLGLAAGFDKNGVGIDALGALGFGHVEIGTVTGEPQPGNPRPRLVRLPADRAVVNRMGFNNDGAEVVARRLATRAARLARAPDSPDAPTRRDFRQRMRRLGGGERAGAGAADEGSRVVVGVNIGKSKVVPDDRAVADYQKSTALLAPYADYLVVNVSSPNTPGLRDLQAVDRLEPLLVAVRRRADEVTGDRRVPLLVKIAPDLADEDVLAVADLATALGLDGIVATNTTISRDRLRSPAADVAAAGTGGLSGAPLAARSLAVLRLLATRVPESLTLVSVGGITTPADARERLAAGASLVQGYTAFVYEGPLWPRRLVQGMAR